MHGVAGRCAAFEVDFVGSGGDLVLGGFGFWCSGFFCFERWGFFRLRHTSLLAGTTLPFYRERKPAHGLIVGQLLFGIRGKISIGWRRELDFVELL